MFVLLFAACILPSERSYPEACDAKEVWWRDADSDGVADGDVWYLGCFPPDGYVADPPPVDPDTGAATETGTDTAPDPGSAAP